MGPIYVCDPLDGWREPSYMSTMPYTPLALANTYIAQYGEAGALDQMKLQKLAFYAYGWWLAYNEAPILTEAPQVWKYGPVFESLYRALRPYGSATIRDVVGEPARPAPQIPITDDLTIRWVEWVWNRYGHLNALQLSDMTHEVGTPWQMEADAKGYRVPKRHPIPDATTRKYFKGLAADLG